MDGKLILEDGSTYRGRLHLPDGVSFEVGEVVFNSSQYGYQEIVTDPSYSGQIMVFSNPHIGNYGVEEARSQSDRIWVEAAVCHRASEFFSHSRSSRSFLDWMMDQRVPVLDSVDTRSLVTHIRDGGVKKGIVCPDSLTDPEEKMGEVADYEDRPHLSDASTDQSYVYEWGEFDRDHQVAVIDFGVKKSILRRLCERGIEPVVVPPAEMEGLNFSRIDGILLSNGPGDPSRVAEQVPLCWIRSLCDRLPVMGICMGHQLLAVAHGAETRKMKFGHRGPNQPVHDRIRDRVLVTSQNHGYTVDRSSLDATDLEVTHVNENDGTVEGFRHEQSPLISVQFHPEANPGPWDSFSFFDRFRGLLDA